MSLKGGQDQVVKQMHHRRRQFVGVEVGPGIAAMAVDGRLHVDPSHALERAHLEGIHTY